MVKLKLKALKRIISVLCAMSMATSFVITSAGAIGTNNAEAAFSMKYMDYLPKPNEDNFDKFSGEYERNENYTDTLQGKRTYNVNYPIDSDKSFITATEEINEKKVYADIQKVVAGLKRKVKNRTPNAKMSDSELRLRIQNKEISKHYKMPKNMRLAKAIYRWVAKNISYDNDSLKEISRISLEKPQDPLYVFAKKTGICVGKANLTNLMMRMAGIPSAVVVSSEHAFNAVYLQDTTNNRKGWTLIDSTWGAPVSDVEMQADEQDKVETMKDMLEMSRDWFVNSGFKEVSDEHVKRINTINRLRNRESLKYSKEYTEKFYTLCENLFEQYKDEYLECIENILKSDNDKQAKEKVEAIVDDMNKRIKAEIDKLNQQYNNIAKFKSFKIKFWSDDVRKAPEENLTVDMEVDLPPEGAGKIFEKFKYWSDKTKGFFPAFYDKALSFKNANEDIIDVDVHKFNQIVFGNWFNKKNYRREFMNLREVMDLNINGVKYEVLGGEEGRREAFAINANNPLENVVISPDLVGRGLKFIIEFGIKSLILKGDEDIDWVKSDSVDLKRVDITESKNYIFKDGQLYKMKEDGSKGERITVPKGITIIDNREEFSRVKETFIKAYKEFRDWKDKEKVNVNSEVIKKIKAVILLSWRLSKQFDIENAKQFIKEAQEAIEMMNEFRNSYKEFSRAKKIFVKVHQEFSDWKDKEKVNVDPEVIKKIKDVNKLSMGLDKKFNIENAKQFIKGANEAIGMMRKFRNSYKEKLKKEFSSVKEIFVKAHKEFRDWKDKEKVNVDLKEFEKIEAVNKLYIKLSKQFNIENAKQFIKEANEAIGMMKKFRNSYNAERCNVVLGLISSLEKDIQKTEEEKNKYVKEIDSKIKNMENEILNLKFLIENAFDNGLDDAQINGLLDANEQKQKELSDLQTQKLNKVAEYNKKIEENNNKLKSLNSEFGEF